MHQIGGCSQIGSCIRLFDLFNSIQLFHNGAAMFIYLADINIFIRQLFRFRAHAKLSVSVNRSARDRLCEQNQFPSDVRCNLRAFAKIKLSQARKLSSATISLENQSAKSVSQPKFKGIYEDKKSWIAPRAAIKFQSNVNLRVSRFSSEFWFEIKQTFYNIYR